MRESTVLRLVAGVVLVTFANLVLQPAIAAAQLPSGPGGALPARAESPEERYSRLLAEMHELLKETVPYAAMPQARVSSTQLPPGVDMAATVDALRAKHRQLRRLEAEVDKSFQATEQHIKDKALPPEILARHQDAVAEYQRRKSEFHARMQSLESAGQGRGDLHSALAEVDAFMAKHPHRRRHTHSDPHNLPWRSPKPVTRKPITTRQGFRTSGLFSAPVLLAQAGSLSGIGLPSVTLPATPMPEDTTPTEDVQITQAIQALAASLGNQPVPIYNWVRNNIESVPSYGSIQGSDMTLQTKRGNAFDTASLLIALLRAANVPARYVYGTIEVPTDKVMNWVGGVTVSEAAQNLMGQGGIPNLGIAEAGRVQWIQLEHVWVEAYVDYVPSRGAVHRAGDTWVPLDASFKQYAFSSGMNIGANVPFDGQGFIAQMQQGATVNQQEGWIQGVNQTAMRQPIDAHQARITQYIATQNPNPTLGDVIGGRKIIQDGAKILYGTLPYKVVAIGSRFQGVPDRLRWKFRYNVYAGDFDRAMDSPFIGIARSTPAIAGKKITLSFKPSTPSDVATLNSYLPQPHPDGSPIELHELPQNLPAYLISLTPELRIDGQVAVTGSGFRMGHELVQNASYFNAASGQWEGSEDNRIIAGEYLATALDLQGTSPLAQLGVRDRLQRTKAALDAGSFSGLTVEDLTGDVLFGNAIGYFAAIDTAAFLTARDAKIITFRMPSYGNFGLLAKTLYFLGVPRTVSFPGMQMDVDHIMSIEVSTDGATQALVAFRRGVGAHYSALEHLVPERAFRQEGSAPGPQGISAVKAINLALTQGQRIFVLGAHNPERHAAALAQVTADADAKNEIAQALAAGKEVTFHQTPINLNGMNGYGYIIIDPETGAGAYKVSGGANGAVILLFASALLAILALFSISGVLPLVGFLGAIAAGAAILPALILMAAALYIILNDPEAEPVAVFFASWAFWRLVVLYMLLPFFPFLGGVVLFFVGLLMVVLSVLILEMTSYHFRPNGIRLVRTGIHTRNVPVAVRRIEDSCNRLLSFVHHLVGSRNPGDDVWRLRAGKQEVHDRSIALQHRHPGLGLRRACIPASQSSSARSALQS